MNFNQCGHLIEVETYRHFRQGAYSFYRFRKHLSAALVTVHFYPVILNTNNFVGECV